MTTTDWDATVVLDSVAPSGVRLTTMLLTYPRFIHAELLTHRCFSRNSASSRAIPAKRKLQAIFQHPVEPCEWGINKGGMSAEEVLSKEDEEIARNIWHTARLVVLHESEKLDRLKVHKQVVNRMGEPWSWMTMLVSSTGWKNFDFLRIHKAAAPEARKIAELRKAAHDASKPQEVGIGQWHLPFIDAKATSKALAFQEWKADHSPLVELLKKMSAARCARLSYLNHENQDPSVEEDLKLFDRLVARDNPYEDPGHFTPLEHQATPLNGFTLNKANSPHLTCERCGHNLDKGERYAFFSGARNGLACFKCALGHVTSGNFLGWHQHRKDFKWEDFDAL